MAFKLAVGNIIDFPVHLKVRDNADVKDFRFNLQAERIDAEQARDLFNDAGQFGNQTVDDFLKGRLTGWRNQRLVVNEDDGQPAPFGPDALAALLSAPGASMAIYMAYLQAVVASNGADGVRKKLTEAVRLWARGDLLADQDRDDDTDPDPEGSELDQAAAVLGLVVVGDVSQHQSAHYWLLPETVPLWNAWQQIQNRWQYASFGLGGALRIGLDLPAVERWLRSQGWGPGKRRSLRRALQAIQSAEAAALKVWTDEALRTRQR